MALGRSQTLRAATVEKAREGTFERPFKLGIFNVRMHDVGEDVDEFMIEKKEERN